MQKYQPHVLFLIVYPYSLYFLRKYLSYHVAKYDPLHGKMKTKIYHYVYFAEKFCTHPAIIVGRLQHLKVIPYWQDQELIEKVDLDSAVK